MGGIVLYMGCDDRDEFLSTLSGEMAVIDEIRRFPLHRTDFFKDRSRRRLAAGIDHNPIEPVHQKIGRAHV